MESECRVKSAGLWGVGFFVTVAAILVVGAGAAHGNFIGDLVYCDVNANGIYDAGDYPLDGVGVRLECVTQSGVVCYDDVFVTGSDPSGVAPFTYFDDFCFDEATWHPVDDGAKPGRYIHETWWACYEYQQTGSWTCRVTVEPDTLPASCNVLVTPMTGGFPIDGTPDGDLCDPEDGPFPEGQYLGNTDRWGGCEQYPDLLPSSGQYTVIVSPISRDECAMYNDFGYTPGGGGGEGCTPGYWKQRHHFDSWEATDYSPDDLFADVFVVKDSENLSLGEALRQGGGGENALYRQATAALLDAAHPEVDYLYSVDDVIQMVQDAYASGDHETTKDKFAAQNEMGCPLD